MDPFRPVAGESMLTTYFTFSFFTSDPVKLKPESTKANEIPSSGPYRISAPLAGALKSKTVPLANVPMILTDKGPPR